MKGWMICKGYPIEWNKEDIEWLKERLTGLSVRQSDYDNYEETLRALSASVENEENKQLD